MTLASGCWRVTTTCHHAFLPLHGSFPLHLESGEVLDRVGLAYESWGKLDSDRRNGILLLHGFTGNSHAASSGVYGYQKPGWWEGLIGPGLALDTNRFFVVCPNVLGGCNGSTGPSSLNADRKPYGSNFPELTIHDLVDAEKRWADALGISRWHAVVGNSLGGMRGLEWAITAPERLERLVLIATTPNCSQEVQANLESQIHAIQMDPAFAGGDYYSNVSRPWLGLALARSIAQRSYSCDQQWMELQDQNPSRDLEAVLAEQAASFAKQYDANSYLVLTKAMSNHDIGRGRGGIQFALRQIRATTLVISISTDRLFTPSYQETLARDITNATLFTLDSSKGHDGFLHEQTALDPLLRSAINS